MRHAVLGMGGVGGFIAAALGRGGCDVTAVVRPEALADYPERVSLESALGTFSVPVARAAVVADAFDVLWIAVKATQLDAALASVRDVSRVGAIVPLLNGIAHVERLRAQLGAERVVPATIALEVERVAPARIVHRSPFAILSVTTDGEARLRESLAPLRALGATVRAVAGEATLMWSKLAFLAPLALTTTAAGEPIGSVVSRSEWRARLEACVAETCAVGAVAGARLDAAFVAGALVQLPPGLRSSMQKDVAAGQPPELDAIAGPIIEGAAAAGIDVPATRELVELVTSVIATRR
jgi:2-dehydropantoate 2-reductase